MNVVGERVLFFGDSLSHPGPDAGPSIVDITRSIGVVSGAPGELIARQLLAAGAQAVRVNAKVGRSARSFLLSEGGTSLLARDQNEFRPTKVIIWLGTNDIDRGLTPDALAKTAAAMAQIRDAYRAMGAEVFALGPPSYPNAKYNNAAPIMLDTIRDVFGADHTFDIRPLTTGAPRAGDGIHFTAVGAAAVAPPIVQMLTAPSAITVAQTGMSRGTKIALGVLGAAGFVGLSWLALRVAKRAAVRSVGQRQPLGALPTTLKKTYVVVSSRLVRGPRGARVGYEAQLIQPGAPVLFNLFQLSKLNPYVTRNYPQLQREHGDTWTAWDAGAGTVHGKVRRDTEDDATAAAIALARKRGYVIVDADLMRAGLPLDENAGFGAILESKYDDVAEAYVGVPITAKNKAKKILARNVEAAYYWRQHDEYADRLTEREAASVDDQIRKLERRISKIVGHL